MPIHERYKPVIPKMVAIWEGDGPFRIQGNLWVVQSTARNMLYGEPSLEQIDQIRQAVVLSPEELQLVSDPNQHETSTFLRLVRGRDYLPPETGRYVHLENTSHDILDTAFALQILESLGILDNDIEGLEEVLLALALQYRNTLQVGRTHGQHAVPQTFGRQMLSHYSSVKSMHGRVEDSRVNISFGKFSGEVGTNTGVEPEVEELALSLVGLKPEPAPDQLIPRWRHSVVLNNNATIAGVLDKLATNTRFLAGQEVGEVQEGNRPSQGSSIMVHKSNPEKSERISGLAREVRKAAAAQNEVTTWMEGDMSHSSTERHTFTESFEILDYMLKLGKDTMAKLVVNTDRMAANLDLTHGCIYSARVYTALTENGRIPGNDAYDRMQRLSKQALAEGVNLQDLVLRDEVISEVLTAAEIADSFDPRFSIRNIGVAYQRLGIEENDPEDNPQ